ncbi:MAG: HAD-IA family hydrolase [Pseudomonadota bacterium]
MTSPRKAVFFDLDGTLADTAPDLAFALNAVREVNDLPPLPLATIRPVASHGARGLLKVGLALEPGMSGYDDARELLLNTYALHICRDTRLFPGMLQVLDDLEAAGTPWGVITNKPGFLTRPLLATLGLATRAAIVVSGDCLPVSKPDPLPLRHAAQSLGLDPATTLLIGDDRRDIQCAHAAGARAWAVAYGYIYGEDDPAQWAADRIVEDVAALHGALRECGYIF